MIFNAITGFYDQEYSPCKDIVITKTYDKKGIEVSSLLINKLKNINKEYLIRLAMDDGYNNMDTFSFIGLVEKQDEESLRNIKLLLNLYKPREIIINSEVFLQLVEICQKDFLNNFIINLFSTSQSQIDNLNKKVLESKVFNDINSILITIAGNYPKIDDINELLLVLVRNNLRKIYISIPFVKWFSVSGNMGYETIKEVDVEIITPLNHDLVRMESDKFQIGGQPASLIPMDITVGVSEVWTMRYITQGIAYYGTDIKGKDDKHINTIMIKNDRKDIPNVEDSLQSICEMIYHDLLRRKVK